MQPRVEILDALTKVKARLGSTTLLTIDGPSGAGKTTLALDLKEALEDVHVIHMDDLYAGWDDALNDDLYARLETQILKPLRAMKPPRYQQFNWHTYQFDTWKEISIPRYLILEGVGSAGVPNRPWISLSIFLQVSDELGIERVRIRDGEEIAAKIPAWQKMQRIHFSEHDTEKFADFVFAF